MLALLILNFILFLILSTFLFLIPGLFLLNIGKYQGKKLDLFFLAGVLGYVVTSLIIYLLLIVNLWILIPPLIIIIDFLFIKKHLPQLKSLTKLKFTKLTSIQFWTLLIFALGILGQLAVIAPSGTIINGDLVFWSALGHDGIWHIALIEQIKNGLYPLQNPVFANFKLVNYHFFSDLTPAFISAYFRFSSSDLFFKFFPFLYSLWLGIGAYLIAKKLSNNNVVAGLWAAIFTYFSGSFGYIVTFLRDHKFSGETLFWSSQVQSSSGNPPQIAALVILLSFIYLFSYYLQNPTKKILAIFCILIAGSLIEFKVYGAIVLFLGLGLVGLIQLIKDHKFTIWLVAFLSGIVSLFLFIPNTQNSTGFLIFQPWWFIRTMIVTPDKLNWLDLELRRQTYLSEHNYKRVLQIETTGFLIFFFGNLGTKFLGLWQLHKLKKIWHDYTFQLVIFTALFALILPLLFLQKGVAGNTIQFLQYFLLLMGILAGITTSSLLNKFPSKFIKIPLILIIILISVPTQIGLLNDFYSRAAFAKVTSSELQALNYLKNNSPQNSTILSAPFNKYYSNKENTPPIWAWSDTAYISALSNRPTFIADTEQLDIMGYDFKNRQKLQEEIFAETDPLKFQTDLNSQQIKYLYLTKLQLPKVDLTQTNLKVVFQNPEVQIWQVN